MILFRSLFWLIFELGIAKAVSRVVVDHACRLHECVANCTAHEFKPSSFEIFGHRIAEGIGGWDAFPVSAFAIDRAAADERPEIRAETAEFRLHRPTCVSIGPYCI